MFFFLQKTRISTNKTTKKNFKLNIYVIYTYGHKKIKNIQNFPLRFTSSRSTYMIQDHHSHYHLVLIYTLLRCSCSFDFTLAASLYKCTVNTRVSQTRNSTRLFFN